MLLCRLVTRKSLIRLSPHPATPGTRRHSAARAGRDPRRDRAARSAARHRDRQGRAVRAAWRVAFPGLGSARAACRRRIRRSAAAARHARCAHRPCRLPPGDVHPPRARGRSDPRDRAARGRSACSPRSIGTCASRRRRLAATIAAASMSSTSNCTSCCSASSGYERVRHAVEAARAQPRPGAAVHVHADAPGFDLCGAPGHRGGAEEAAIRTPRCWRWKPSRRRNGRTCGLCRTAIPTLSPQPARATAAA